MSITSRTPESEANVKNNKVILIGTPATSLIGVMAVMLEHHEVKTCIAEMFDESN